MNEEQQKLKNSLLGQLFTYDEYLKQGINEMNKQSEFENKVFEQFCQIQDWHKNDVKPQGNQIVINSVDGGKEILNTDIFAKYQQNNNYDSRTIAKQAPLIDIMTKKEMLILRQYQDMVENEKMKLPGKVIKLQDGSRKRIVNHRDIARIEREIQTSFAGRASELNNQQHRLTTQSQLIQNGSTNNCQSPGKQLEEVNKIDIEVKVSDLNENYEGPKSPIVQQQAGGVEGSFGQVSKCQSRIQSLSRKPMKKRSTFLPIGDMQLNNNNNNNNNHAQPQTQQQQKIRTSLLSQEIVDDSEENPEEVELEKQLSIQKEQAVTFNLERLSLDDLVSFTTGMNLKAQNSNAKPKNDITNVLQDITNNHHVQQQDRLSDLLSEQQQDYYKNDNEQLIQQQQQQHVITQDALHAIQQLEMIEHQYSAIKQQRRLSAVLAASQQKQQLQPSELQSQQQFKSNIKIDLLQKNEGSKISKQMQMIFEEDQLNSLMKKGASSEKPSFIKINKPKEDTLLQQQQYFSIQEQNPQLENDVASLQSQNTLSSDESDDIQYDVSEDFDCNDNRSEYGLGQVEIPEKDDSNSSINNFKDPQVQHQHQEEIVNNANAKSHQKPDFLFQSGSKIGVSFNMFGFPKWPKKQENQNQIHIVNDTPFKTNKNAIFFQSKDSQIQQPQQQQTFGKQCVSPFNKLFNGVKDFWGALSSSAIKGPLIDQKGQKVNKQQANIQSNNHYHEEQPPELKGRLSKRLIRNGKPIPKWAADLKAVKVQVLDQIEQINPDQIFGSQCAQTVEVKNMFKADDWVQTLDSVRGSSADWTPADERLQFIDQNCNEDKNSMFQLFANANQNPFNSQLCSNGYAMPQNNQQFNFKKQQQ